MRRRTVGALMAGALVLAGSVVACSDDNESSDDPTATVTASVEATSQPTGTGTPAPTEATPSETPSTGGGGAVPPAPFAVTSPAWEPGGEIPAIYTCDAENTSPPLEFTRFNQRTQSLAIVMDDPDAPGGSFIHWLAWNIEPGMVPEGTLPAGAVEGTTDFGEVGYGGPCPPARHEYVITVYELDVMLDLEEGASLDEFRAAIEGHVLAEASYRGVFG